MLWMVLEGYLEVHGETFEMPVFDAGMTEWQPSRNHDPIRQGTQTSSLRVVDMTKVRDCNP